VSSSADAGRKQAEETHGRDAHATADAYATHGKDGLATAPAAVHVKSMEYCHRMELAYAAADLVLCRAGAVTVAELSALGKPTILMPYPYHKDQHQRHNAAALAASGAAIVCDDAKDAAANAQSLRQILLPLMADDAALAHMREAAAHAARSDGAREVAMWLSAQGK
jgi:UDP-N-acetylglucosamine--N-acetylmuramyl-(pentapeptide) pyrophosphoryl-undecaprenol N-acetylglucosamine transferase